MLKRLGLAGLAVVAIVAMLVLYISARHLIYLSPREEVTFPSGTIQLAGTLVKPSDGGAFPAIVLLHGSGPEPRSEPPTRAVVNTLVKSGFAVLLYDKRGVAASGGDFDSATFQDFINDAVAAIDYLRGRSDVDADNIGLYAVSESGWLAPEIAVRTQRVKFIFNKVGSPLSWMETVQWETRNDYLADGVAESDVQQLVDLAKRRWAYYQAAAANPSLAEGPERDAINAEISRVRAEVPMADEALSAELSPYDAESYQSFAVDASYDPTPFLNQIDIPMYYTYGGVDINIPTERCVAVLEKLKKEQGKNIGITVYPNVGHSLATWRGLLDVGFVPGYLDTLAAWTGAQVNARRIYP